MTQDTRQVSGEVTVDHVESPLTLEMTALLDFDTSSLTGQPIKETVSVEYNAESQRFQVTFNRKPLESVRTQLKSMGLSWNKWEYSWDLYTWQVRLYNKEGIGRFLSALNRGLLIEVPTIPDGAKRQWWKDVKDKQKQALEELAEGVEAERSSEDFRELLRVVKSFHRYSHNNLFSIMLQCPSATLVTGERKWNQLGRYVKWGEEPIIILGPRIKKVKEWESNPATGKREQVEKKVLAGFLALPVYDVSQTHGAELPKFKFPSLTGDDAKLFLETMKDFCEEHKIEATFKDLSDEGVKGWSMGGKIEVSDVEAINQQFSTTIHEVAHEYLEHAGKFRPQHIQEAETEGVAHIVLKFFELPSKAPTYIAFQGATKNTIKDSAETILKVSQLLIHYIIEKTGWGMPE